MMYSSLPAVADIHYIAYPRFALERTACTHEAMGIAREDPFFQRSNMDCCAKRAVKQKR